MDDDCPNARPSRRAFLTMGAVSLAAGSAGGVTSRDISVPTATLPWQDGDAAAPDLGPRTGTGFLTAAERAFVGAAADRLIPPDGAGPGAVEAGVVDFIDRQLAGSFGQGAHLYLGGPWAIGTPSQGPQQREAPAPFYRAAIAETDDWTREAHGHVFADLSGDDRDAALRALEGGTARLRSIDAAAFFTMLWENVRQGYFADPIYGGNRDMTAWRMIGFPGARYDYLEWVDRHGKAVSLPPTGLLGRSGWEAG